MSRSQKVNEPETMSTASAYLYKEQAECVQQVHQYLVEHLDSRVTQAELAQRYHISLTSLKGAFKQVYGLPINTYLRRCRVQHAEQLLFTTDLSILEIAQRVGYDSPSRFAAMFKREKGITPRESCETSPITAGGCMQQLASPGNVESIERSSTYYGERKEGSNFCWWYAVWLRWFQNPGQQGR